MRKIFYLLKTSQHLDGYYLLIISVSTKSGREKNFNIITNIYINNCTL